MQGEVRNTRDPSGKPSSRQGASYKSKTKSSTAQRESEGIVVPKSGARAERTNAVKNNAAGGKGPWGGHAGGAGKREGMAGKTGPNDPGGRRPRDKVQQLQDRLGAAAKRAPGRRFHALYDHTWRSDVLHEAWKRVRKNRGAAGIDGQSIRDVEQYGVERFLEELAAELRGGEYRPSVVRRRYIPKADGRKRPLGIPTVRDRVVQMAAKLVLEPVFEADFLPCSYGFRPKRSATMALEVLRKRGAKGGHHVLDADIKDFFGSIDHDKLMKLMARRVSDRRMLKLLRQWLEAGVMEESTISKMVAGTPQGGVISPLLANIYLHAFDQEVRRRDLGLLVRYADDFVIMTRTPALAQAALAGARDILASMGLELHPDKTRVVDLREGREGFDFLGCHFRARMSGRLWEQRRIRRYYLHRWPSRAAMKRLREKVRDRTGASRKGTPIEWIIEELTPILRGWGNYFRTGNAADKFTQIDRYVVWRLRRLQVKKRGRNLRAGQADQWTEDWFNDHGLYRLRGTVRYPKAA